MNIQRYLFCMISLVISFPLISMDNPIKGFPTSFLSMTIGAREKLQDKINAREVAAQKQICQEIVQQAAQKAAQKVALEQRKNVVFEPQVVSAQMSTESICDPTSPQSVVQWPRSILKTSPNYTPKFKK